MREVAALPEDPWRFWASPSALNPQRFNDALGSLERLLEAQLVAVQQKAVKKSPRRRKLRRLK